MINSYHFWKMVTIITPIVAALITGFAGYNMYRIKSKLDSQNQIEFVKSQDAHNSTISVNQNETRSLISDVDFKINRLLENTAIDPRGIEKYIREIPLKKGQSEIEVVINRWYNEKKITPNEKELLFVLTSSINEQTQALTEEIKDLKKHGKSEFAEFLQNIQSYITNGDAKKITDEYFKSKEKWVQQNVSMLKESIQATMNLFAFAESKELFNELVSLQPTAENYFHFAYFSAKLNYFDEAIINYKSSLNLFQQKDDKNSNEIIRNIALIQNNLAILQVSVNQYKGAFLNYNEA